MLTKSVVRWVALLLVLVFTGCASLSQAELNKLHELEGVGVSPVEVKVKNPGIAAACNLFLGFGNFYNASGTDETDQWMVGTLNLLTWPLSILWGIPGAAHDATVINQKETVRYYTYMPEGQKRLKELKLKYQQE